MLEPLVDHIIAVHNPNRPLYRAASSVLDHTEAPVRLSVVCHNTEPDAIRRNLGSLADDPRLRLLHLADGIHSPTGPFNAGLAAATAPFTSIMGSDDELEAGAIDSWLAIALRDDAHVVIPRLAHALGVGVPTPPVRPFRSSRLDGVRDRLSYRSAPLGLVSRERFGALRMMTGVATGEDVEYATALWFSNARISRDRRGPAYLIHSDAADRVTLIPKPVEADLDFLLRLLDGDVFASLSEPQRNAVTVKLIRVHVFAIVHNRPDPNVWTGPARVALADGLARCLAASPAAATVLSVADRALMDLIRDVDAPASDLLDADLRRRRYLSPSALVPRNPFRLLSREAAVRFGAASALVRSGR